jgi:outer membrane murein-binding lipoprotein Lpp
MPLLHGAASGDPRAYAGAGPGSGEEAGYRELLAPQPELLAVLNLAGRSKDKAVLGLRRKVETLAGTVAELRGQLDKAAKDARVAELEAARRER